MNVLHNVGGSSARPRAATPSLSTVIRGASAGYTALSPLKAALHAVVAFPPKGIRGAV